VRSIFPQIKDAQITHRWTGLVCITPDFLPHYHVPAPGVHVALGFNGRGVAFANRTGAWLANRIRGQEDSVGIPETPISRIPFHAFRAPALNVYMRWNAWMDALGR
jgi:glycine/D-amino acid oxidase-like deaminating enzyme